MHSAMTPEERQDHFIEQDVRELDDSITRREEVMCAELIANGEIRVRGYIDDNLNNYVDDDINYQLPAKILFIFPERINGIKLQQNPSMRHLREQQR